MRPLAVFTHIHVPEEFTPLCNCGKISQLMPVRAWDPCYWCHQCIVTRVIDPLLLQSTKLCLAKLWFGDIMYLDSNKVMFY